MDEVKPDIVKDMKANIGTGTHLAVSFDTTGSMASAIAEVRQKLRDLVETISADIPNFKIALISHNDYCDGDNCLHFIDFTDDLEKLMQFITTVAKNGSGGDAAECYEYALQTAKSLSWPKEGGSVILIGDDEPHPVGYPKNPTAYGASADLIKNEIDWREEVKEMAEKNIKVFPLQCLYNQHRAPINNFWEEVSQLSGTPLLMLESFGDSANVFEAVAYAASGGAAMEFYNAKVNSEMSKGLRVSASNNMTDIRSKLSAYASGPESKTPEPEVKSE